MKRGKSVMINSAPLAHNSRDDAMAEAANDMKERVQKMRRAAVAFANDYGPLPAANQGDEKAMHAVATRMFDALRKEGLHVVMRPVQDETPRCVACNGSGFVSLGAEA